MKIADDRTKCLEVDDTPAGQQTLLFPRCVLEAISPSSQDVLPFQGMATTFQRSQIDGAMCSNRKTLEALARSSQEVLALASRARTGQIESGSDMRDLPSEGA